MKLEQHILDVLTGEACWVVVKFNVNNDYSSSHYQESKTIEKTSKKYNALQIWRICKWIVNQPIRSGTYYIADYKDIHKMVNITVLHQILINMGIDKDGNVREKDQV